MNTSGDNAEDVFIRARRVLLDALEALEEQREAIIVIGAQAVYLCTGDLDVALAPATKDSDLSIDPRNLNDDPLIEEAMRSAGFLPDEQPGAWLSSDDIPVDLMVPELLAGAGRRSVRIPPHGKSSARKARGIEATLVDYYVQEVTSLNPIDKRSISVKVAGPAALLVAKIHKITERLEDKTRLSDKDAHDLYRILVKTETIDLRDRIINLLNDELSSQITREGLVSLEKNFSKSDAQGPVMAGRAEEGVGNPEQVSIATLILVNDLLNALKVSGIKI